VVHHLTVGWQVMNRKWYRVRPGVLAIVVLGLLGIAYYVLTADRGKENSTFTFLRSNTAVCDRGPTSGTFAPPPNGPLVIDLDAIHPAPMDATVTACTPPTSPDEDPNFNMVAEPNAPAGEFMTGPNPTALRVAPRVKASANTRLRVSNGVAAFTPPMYRLKPTLSGTFKVDADVKYEDDGRLNGSITIKVGSLEIESTKLVSFEQQGLRLVVSAEAKTHTARYFVTLAAQAGDLGSVLVTVTSADGTAVFDNTDPYGVDGALRPLSTGRVTT
jgi:hypothetical protein